MPKSILKTNAQVKDQVFHYPFSNLGTEQTPDKNQNHQGIHAASFLHSEHGRCVTSHAITQNQSLFQQNGRTYSQQQIKGSLGANINMLFNKMRVSGGQGMQNSGNQAKQQQSNLHSSPDRLREFKLQGGNIDKLVRQNIKRMKSKEEEEKHQKQQQQEHVRKRKELQDYKNTMVRKINKEKIYRKTGPQTHHNYQQSQDIMLDQSNFRKTGFNESQVHDISRNINKRDQLFNKQSQTQKLDFEQINKEEKRLNIKNHRKSYGLEFIEIKKEIQDELRTLDEKFKQKKLVDRILEDSKEDLIFEKEFEEEKPQKQRKARQVNKENVRPEDEFQTQKLQPVDKVVVIKKNKIRKFMQDKKRQLIIQKVQGQKDEMLRTLKMQENIIRLNQFCKKKLQKNIHKKRIATIQNDERCFEEEKKEISKLSARKLNFDDGGKKVIYHKIEQPPLEQDLIQDDSSRLSTEFYEEYFRLINSIKKEREFQKIDNQSRNDTSINNITTKSFKNLLSSPKGEKSLSPEKKKQSIVSPKNQSKHAKKKGKGGAQLNKRAQSKVSLQTKQQLQQQSRATLKSSEKLRTKERAESAPLLLHQNITIKKKQRKSPHQKQNKGLKRFTNEEEFYQYVVQQVIKIQQYYRIHLYRRGFYSSNNVPQYSEEVKSSGEFQTQIFKGDNQDSLGQQNQVNPQVNREDDYDDEQEAEDVQDLIIINQQSQDDNKIVYMSNINSCSLPQTPKIEEGKITMRQLPKVFDYKPQDAQAQNHNLFMQNFDQNDYVHQSISQKPSIQTPDNELDQDDLLKNTVQRIQVKSESQEDNKTDYEMRIFTGSESLLREFKNHTPKTIPDNKIAKGEQYSHLNINKEGSNPDSKSSQSIKEVNSSSSQSIFERNSFQQFTMQKLDQMMKNNEYMNLIEMREKALVYRENKETKFIKKMYKNRQISPRTYTIKKDQLEKWVQLERDEIQKTKKQFQEEWQKTLQMIEETQKNVRTMREKMKINIENQHKNNQFHSYSSRNSSSSYATVSKQEARKSILEQEEYQPISSRSIRLSVGSDKNKPISILDQRSSKAEELRHIVQRVNDSAVRSEAKKEDEKLLDFLESSFKQKKQKQITVDKASDEARADDDSLQQKINEFINDEELPSGFKGQQLKSKSRGGDFNDEKSLARSRSEQDLSDLIKKSQINLENLDIDHLDKIQESKRFHQRPLIQSGAHEEIKIQENLFEDSSNRYSKGKNYYQDMHDLQSNDSLLNESELNNYFQDQKFSIEDFKQLDKRKILDQNFNHEDGHNEDEEDEDLLRNESQLALDQQAHVSLTHSEQPINEGERFFDGNCRPVIHQSEVEDKEPEFKDLRTNLESATPEIEQQHVTAFMQHQQTLLLNQAKPGENIKIADILRKTQNLTDPNLSSNGFNDNSILFQNQQINLSMSTPPLPPLSTADHAKLADQMTDEILRQLLSTEITVPNRMLSADNTTHQLHLFHQEPVADVFVIDAQKNDKELAVQVVEYKQRIMVEQDMIRVENFINEIIQLLQQHELMYLTQLAQNPSMVFMIDTSQNFHRKFLSVLTSPIKRNELEQLNLLQTSEIGSYEHFETSIDPNSFPILPIDLYLEIERLREESQMRALYSQGFTELDLESSIIQESVHIHNKAIFDALNESLLKFRPYGISGEPMPWSNKNRRLQTKVDANSVDTERLFIMVKQDVLRWVQTFSGCQPTQVFVCKRSPDQNAPESFDEEIFQEFRERRLANQLATEVIESEHQWLNYDFEEAQVKIDLSDMILEHLVEEVAIFLNQKNGILINE